MEEIPSIPNKETESDEIENIREELKKMEDSLEGKRPSLKFLADKVSTGKLQEIEALINEKSEIVELVDLEVKVSETEKIIETIKLLLEEADNGKLEEIEKEMFQLKQNIDYFEKITIGSVFDEICRNADKIIIE